MQELRHSVSGIIAVKPEGDKASRMAVASAKFEAGQALLPHHASWLPDLEAELFVFPGSRHDDQCDSINQALLNDSMWSTAEYWQAVLAYITALGPRPVIDRLTRFCRRAKARSSGGGDRRASRWQSLTCAGPNAR